MRISDWSSDVCSSDLDAPPAFSSISIRHITVADMNLQELKRKTPAELLAYAEELQIENASTLRKQDMMFAILKQLAENDIAIYGDGVLEIQQDRSEEHTSELQSLMRISYAVFCLKKKKNRRKQQQY